MEQRAGGRRRIDRVSAPDLLEGLDGQSQAVVRALRDDCRDEEARLSYARRVVQGQLDIARMVLQRREQGEPEPADLVERLTVVLTDEPSGSTREARTVSFYSPDEQPDRRSGDAVTDSSLGRLPDMEPEAIRSFVAELEAEEQRVSDLRRAVLANLDGLQAELVRRYREGDADVDAILSAALPPRDEA